MTIANASLAALAELLGASAPRYDAEEILDLCRRHAGRLAPFVADTTELLWSWLGAGEAVLFEGANSALLDPDFGTFPFVTSSSGTPPGVPLGTGLPLFMPDRILGVMKAYGSRVGNGPFPTEVHGEEAERLRRKGNEFGTATGRPRRVGDLDLVLARATAVRCGVTGIVLTGLGVLAGRERVRYATAWTVDGVETDRIPASVEDFFSAEPILVERPGWPGPIGSCRSYEELPSAAREFVGEIAARVAPVEYVAVGPARDQLLPGPGFARTNVRK